MPAPRGREKHVTDNGKGVAKRGDGLGTGPVGGRGQSSGGKRSGSGSSGGGQRSPLMTIILLAVLLLGGGGGAASMLGGGSGETTTPSTAVTSQQTTTQQTPSQSSSNTGSTANVLTQAQINSLMNSSSTGSTWNSSEDTGNLDTEVASGTRSKYTTIKGNGKDQTTIMIFVCGTDLEQRGGMATKDMQEMAAASFDDRINLILYTGGCSGWKVSGISTQTNQIYQIKNGKMYQLESNMGAKAMTEPATLTEFINYCKKNYPANRNDLIFWDHGGGSITGYGYDQKFQSTGSMDLAEISTALKNTKMTFDFIGFDACLMATAENALMLADYADYLIASEETEPGIGWYYTGWLTEYGKNPSMDTLSIGKKIADDFVSECGRQCAGQLTTLSVIDLAEFSNTVPEKLTAFAESTSQLIKDKQYTTVSKARQGSREFAQSSKIDQCDLIDLANRIGTDEAKDLANTLKAAIKYNKTSSNMTSAYGVSVYFPYLKKNANVNTAVSINNQIGMDSAFNQCLKDCSSIQGAGQTAGGYQSYSGSPLGSLLGSSSSSAATGDVLAQLLNAYLNASMESSSGRSITQQEVIDFVAENQFDSSQLTWQKGEDGSTYLTLTAEQWELVNAIDQNMFFDDGKGYIDLGCDNLFTITEAGQLVADTDYTWLAIDGQPVAYYHLSTVDDGTNYSITGFVPAMLNDERVELYLVFDNENPYGFISGYSTDYHDGETETVAKAYNELQAGDKLDFLCDYYSYDGEYQDSYYLGETLTVTDSMEISNVAVDKDSAKITYKITDIYGQDYWTPVCQ